MSESRSPVTLGELAAADYPRPAVVALGETDAVVLDYATLDTVAVWQHSAVHQEAATTLVTPTSDPERRQLALRRTLLGLNHQRRQALAARETDAATQAATLQQIRTYAIGKHRDSIICRDGLNDFLEHFELGTYEPRQQLRFVITGSYEVEGEDAAAVRETVPGAMGLHTIDICGLDRESVTFATTVTDVTVVKLGDEPRLRVAYELRGTGLIDSSDLAHSRSDAEAVLEPYIAGVADLVADSAQFRLEVDLDEVE